MESERNKIASRIEVLRLQLNDAMRGRVVPSAKAVKIRQEIDSLYDQMHRLDRDATERLALEKAPIDEVLEVIALPLLADVMNDVVAGVDAMLRRNGCQETVFGIYTSQIKKAALAMVNTLDHADDKLPRLLDVDDTLVDAVKKKLMSFIKQHLNITKIDYDSERTQLHRS